MIEALVKYIESKGFLVQVRTEALTIYKVIDRHGRTAGCNWAISPLDIQDAPQEALFEEADKRMGWIDAQIAQVYK